MFDRLLIPLDRSEMSQRALAVTRWLSGETVRLLRVEPNFQVLRPGPLENFRPDWQEVVTADVMAELEPLAQRLRDQGKQVDILVRFGDPAAEIIAAGSDADLIVMNTHGRSTSGRALFGSVADRVARHGATSTLLIRGGQYPVEGDTAQRIVVPLDGSALAEQALPVAEWLAIELGVPVRLVYVIDIDQPLETVGDGDLRWRALATGDAELNQQQRAAHYLTEHVQQLAARGIGAGAVVETGVPAVVLLDLITPSDLVVMTTRGQGGLQRWVIGSVADKLVREAVAPVLLVRRAGQPTPPPST